MENKNPFSFIMTFLKQDVPKSSRGRMPEYYRKALMITNILQNLLYLLIILIVFTRQKRLFPLPVTLLAVNVLKNVFTDKIDMRANLIVQTVVTVLWCTWYINLFGWNSGGQHFLIPLLMLIFFAVYVYPWEKICYFLILIGARMGLFYHTLHSEPVVVLGTADSVLFQTVNSLFMFVIMAANCIVFSTNIQEYERQLLIDNEELQHEAETDLLTELPNRRSMQDEMNRFKKLYPEEQFSICIADIDFFKKVNDTYGHNCGDYTLKQLAECFRNEAKDRYHVCRWGGEEFCFFFPKLNLDEAGTIMRDVSLEVSKMTIEFEGTSLHITITAGVEENDFKSSLDELIEQADHKLYIGKSSGRNCVIV